MNCCIARIGFKCCKRDSITAIGTGFDEVAMELLCFIEVDVKSLLDVRNIWFWLALSESQSGGVVLIRVLEPVN